MENETETREYNLTIQPDWNLMNDVLNFDKHDADITIKFTAGTSGNKVIVTAPAEKFEPIISFMKSRNLIAG